VAWLDHVVQELAIDQIIPVGALSCALLSRHRDGWQPSTRVVLADPDRVATALDKLAVGRLAEAVGIAVPRTVQPRSLDRLQRRARASAIHW
jgi:hypothetical protein